ncbi:glycosyltransferase [Salegentibacter flavus]|uniref:Glycosyltransferase 2-like domain-containing protein n=1 Tax=Salegentibacter flavus TaxID=287099 RepID=A0A1I4Y4Y2_9FLAO|nr:glycosyltransferase [Salegentibacter flavus]SFN33141.1 hypothetical protein SAMN05660413_00529 [Salegentibacter flavus]
MDKALSIIIACYNDIDVRKAVEAASFQTYVSKEIIVVDDGSNEATKEVIASVKDKIDILIEQKNSGQSIARNNGIKKATGNYILNWDSDDYFEPEFSEKAIPKFQEDEAIKIVTCKARRFDKKGTIDIFTPRGGKLEDFLFRNSALGSAMFKKTDWEACGGYEENLPILGFEDWEFYIQLLKSGGYAYVIPEILFHYQVRPDSTTAQIKSLKQEKYKHIILKHPEIYKANFVGLIDDLFKRIEQKDREQLKIYKTKEWKAGKFLLSPFRFLKVLKQNLVPKK